MKVLFVSSGNSEFFEVIPFIKSQGESLRKGGIEIDYFTIKGKGFIGYLKNVKSLRNYVLKTNPDVIHSHYSLSGWVVVLARTGKPKVLSLMGTDTHGGVFGENNATFKIKLTKLQVKLIQLFYPIIIVKSNNLLKSIWKKRSSYVIPNGINYSQFKVMDVADCRSKLNLPLDEKLILFLAKKTDPNKNFKLLEQALPHIKTKNIKIVTPFPVPHEKVPVYLNAANVLVFTSFKEGSPNVIKEALVCNTPIVATKSGDVLEQTHGLKNVLICNFDKYDLALKIDKMLSENIDEDSRSILKPRIDEDVIAEKLITIYKKLITDEK